MQLLHSVAEKTPMNVATPHYLLYLEASRSAASGQWRFSLQTPDGHQRFEAADVEPGIQGDRLDLLTAVRALEALDEPSQVTLVGCSTYVRQGMQYGLDEWRTNGWQWEYYGQMVPVKNGDLWQRLDRALRFHRVELKQRRIDGPHPRLAGPHPAEPSLAPPSTVGDAENDEWGVRVQQGGWVRYAGPFLSAVWRRRLDAAFRRCLRIAAQAWDAIACRLGGGGCSVRDCVEVDVARRGGSRAETARLGGSCTAASGVTVQLPSQQDAANGVAIDGSERVSA
jgi:ribonuclease HI